MKKWMVRLSAGITIFCLLLLGGLPADAWGEITPNPVSVPGDAENTYRLAGTDRYATAAEIALHGWKVSDYAVLASGDNFPDALCGSPLAGKYDAPILLTSKDKLNDSTRAVFAALGVKEVFIVGGPDVISTAVEQTIEDSGITVTRIAGSNRFETSLFVAMQLGTFDKAVVATGSNFPDALSIAPIAALKGYPILLTGKDSIDPNILAYLKDKAASVMVVGGTGVISDTVLDTLPAPTRLDGDNRYDTNLAVIQHYADSLNFTHCYTATGENYPDALSGSALAAMTSAPVFLTGNPAPAPLLTFIQDREVTSITAFGGIEVIPSDVLNSLSAQSYALTKPANPMAVAINSKDINLSWAPVPDAESYAIYRAVSETGTYARIKVVLTTSYLDTGLFAEKTYYYKIQASGSAGMSDLSDSVFAQTASVGIPSNLTASALSSNEIKLTWNTVRDADSYSIYRADQADGPYSVIAASVGLEYTNTGLEAGKTYFYKIRAYNGSSFSAYSEPTSADTLSL
ncbi:cell wall-binding repeat-containing protein [Dehalobacter sp. DCM]|uniref:cell wall-binding repeat-containing protein n=1 Tax=Dehalobacter sp. DCM TaxID=2907827 RepID=UPI0030814262|nr:cell wall-binding repeat-containing protein [Dehalobacter sp. DCM]